MSYEKDQFGGGPGGGEGSVSVSTMIATALAPYVTSNSVSIAIANYITSNSTSAMITTRLSSYITSSSVATALTAYATSNSVSIMIAAAVAPYATSNSLSIGLAAKNGTITVQDEGVGVGSGATTFNFVGTGISASQTGAIVTITAVAGAGSGETSVSVSTMISTALGGGYTSTASLAAVTLSGRPLGSVLLGATTMSNVNNFSFSGSWSDFGVLQMYAMYRIETGTSASQSCAIYTDGGTTVMLGLGTVSSTASANQAYMVDLKIMGGDGRANKVLSVNTVKATGLNTFAGTATANTGFVNCIKWTTSATITAGVAYLYGWRKT